MTTLRFLALSLLLFGTPAHAAFDTWEGSTPFATGLGNRVIGALAVSPDGMTAYAGTGSGTVLRYVYSDATPDAFSFTAQTGAALSSVATSNTITVAGINSAAAIGIAGGSYSIDGGIYVSTAGTVNNGDIVTVQQTSSGSFSTLTTATLTIGGIPGSFNVTTAAAPVVNSACGSANGVATGSAPSANLCAAGTASAVAGSGPWTWSCHGSGGGNDASCSAPLALLNQTISFGAAPGITVGGNGTVTATATSGLAVSFTSTTTGICTVSGSTVTGVAAGACTIAADQAGNASYNPAPQVTQSITIGKNSQTISFGATPSITVGGTGTVSATATSGLAVSFTSTTTGICTVSGSTVTGIAAGTCTIAADQAGDASYNPAPQVTQNITIGKNSQTISFGAAPAVAVGGTGTATATATSGLAVGFASTTTGICTVSGSTVTGIAAGTCTIAADQAGDASYAAAPQATQNITVGQNSQTISFGAAPAVAVGGNGTVTATATSGLAVSFTSTTTGICTVSGSTVTGIAAGICTIAADQAGDASYNPAPQVTQNITIGKNSQTISFGASPAVAVGGTGTVSATATSGLAVSFTSTTTGICTVSGSTVTGIAAGTCTIAADQAGDASYNPAPQVTQNITIGDAPINGACGSANGIATAFVPSANLCSAGTPSAVAVGSPWTWSCNGSGGGTDASCSAPNQTTGGGSGRAVISGGTWVVDTAQSAGFIPTSGHAKSPPSLPPGVSFPYGLLDFTLNAGAPGSAATITITYSAALPAGAVYWKYGPSPDGYNCSGAACAAAHWYQMPPAQAVFAGNTVTLTITDGGVGDDDLAANGVIVDQGGPGGGASSIPTLSEWALLALAGLMGLFGMRAMRRRALLERL